MKSYKFIVSSLLLVVFFFSCKEDTLLTFDSDTQIYFDYHTEQNEKLIRDSIDFSFTYERLSVVDTIISLQVRIMGDTANIDRPFAFSIAPGSTAREGVHYDIHSARIPAGKEKGDLAIKVYRTKDMEDEKFSLFFQLKENEYFSADYSLHTFNDSLYNVTTFKVYISDMLVAPAKWATYQSYFGDFSAKKMRLMAEIMNVELARFEDLSILEMSAYGVALRRYLDEQKAAGTPVLEEDGSEMTAGAWVY